MKKGSKSYIRQKRKELREEKQLTIFLLLRRDGDKCRGCFKVLQRKDMTIDHIRPLSKGGRNNISNLCIMCPKCNLKKGSWRGASSLMPTDVADQNKIKEAFDELKKHNSNVSLWINRLRKLFNLRYN